jgi:hypothetical protein
MKPTLHRRVALVASSCAATLALVATVNLSCGSVRTKDACAQGCPDVAELQEDLVALEQEHATLQQSHAALAAKVEALEESISPPEIVVRVHEGTPIQGVHYTFVMDCDAGQIAIGGGAGFTGNLGSEELQQSYPRSGTSRPNDGDVPTGWIAIIENYHANPQTPIGYVVCAKF